MSFLNKLFSFFHGGDSASDTSTDPAYAYLPDNIFHNTSVDLTYQATDDTVLMTDTVTDLAFASLSENIYHNTEVDPLCAINNSIGDTDFGMSSGFDDSFSSSSFDDTFSSGFDSGFISGFGDDF